MPSISFDNRHFEGTAGGGFVAHWFDSSIAQSWTNISWYYTTIKVMQNTEPSNFSGFTANTSYDSDLLFTVTPSVQSAPTATQVTSGEYWTMNFNHNVPVVATGTGTATWFWMYADGTTNSTGGTPRLMARGSVGATGSGADLEIANTSITNGSTYLITSLKFLIPLNYSW